MKGELKLHHFFELQKSLTWKFLRGVRPKRGENNDSALSCSSTQYQAIIGTMNLMTKGGQGVLKYHSCPATCPVGDNDILVKSAKGAPPL